MAEIILWLFSKTVGRIAIYDKLTELLTPLIAGFYKGLEVWILLFIYSAIRDADNMS